jgi:outer membrane protein assembly factor BamE (lipoprotein component of BamABCDE complex)
MTMKFHKDALFLLLGTAAILGACTPTVTERGNMLEDYQTGKIVTGIHTRSDVLRILGSPTTTAPFDENTWYYLGQETEKKGILDPKILKEKIYVVTFNDEGIVQDIRLSQNGRIDVPVSTAHTPTHGTEMTVMQQMLGNLGRFNAPKESAVNTAGGTNR